MIRSAILLALLLVTACGDLPRDPAGTSDRIQARGVLRVGVTSTSATLPGEGDAVRALLRGLSADLGARAELRRGATEPMLAQLESGELDLVVAVLDDATPWAGTVGLGPRLVRGDFGGRPHAVRPVVRAGENALLMRVWDRSVALGARP